VEVFDAWMRTTCLIPSTLELLPIGQFGDEYSGYNEVLQVFIGAVVDEHFPKRHIVVPPRSKDGLQVPH
jgi:hypothetical protein